MTYFVTFHGTIIIVFWLKCRWSLSLRFQLMMSIDSGNGMAPDRQQAINWTKDDLVHQLVPPTTITRDINALTKTHIIPQYPRRGLVIVSFALATSLAYCKGFPMRNNNIGLQSNISRFICYICMCLKSMGMYGITIAVSLHSSGGNLSSLSSPRQQRGKFEHNETKWQHFSDYTVVSTAFPWKEILVYSFICVCKQYPLKFSLDNRPTHVLSFRFPDELPVVVDMNWYIHIYVYLYIYIFQIQFSRVKIPYSFLSHIKLHHYQNIPSLELWNDA